MTTTTLVRLCPPVDITRMFVGSPYGIRHDSATGALEFHAGVDFCGQDVPEGYPVFAITNGIVRFVFCEIYPETSRITTDGYGNCVLIEHPDLGLGPRGTPWCSWYAHLQDFSVSVGDRVEAGQQIARIGHTRNGRSSMMGPHLHFEIRNLRADTAANEPPNLMPGNNNTLLGYSDDVHYRPGPNLSTYGTTADPIDWFGQRGITILREPDTNGNRRGTVQITGSNAFNATGNVAQLGAYRPRALPPQNGWAFAPVLDSASQLPSARRRLARAASAATQTMAGLGLTHVLRGLGELPTVVPGPGAVPALVLTKDPATTTPRYPAGPTLQTSWTPPGSATTASASSVVKVPDQTVATAAGAAVNLPTPTATPPVAVPPPPDQAASTAPAPSGSSEDAEGGRVNLTVPVVDPSTQGPPSLWAVMGVAASATIYGVTLIGAFLFGRKTSQTHHNR